MKYLPIVNSEKVVIVDEGDFDWLLSLSKWYGRTIDGETYVYGYFGYGSKILIHRIIMGVNDPDIKVDHKNRNTLDCRRENLRIATNQQNSYNQKIRNTNTSGYKGVCPNPKKTGKKWRAYIMKDNKQISLGTFDDVETAGRVYDKYAAKLFGEFACLNFPNEDNSDFDDGIKRTVKTSKYKGVSKTKYSWRAFYRECGKTKHIGTYKTEEEAYQARQEYLKKWQQQLVA